VLSCIAEKAEKASLCVEDALGAAGYRTDPAIAAAREVLARMSSQLHDVKQVAEATRRRGDGTA